MVASGDETVEVIPSYASKNGKEAWNSQPPANRRRLSAENFMKQKEGVTTYAIHRVDTIESSLDLFFASEIVQTIVEMTNKEGSRVLTNEWKNVTVQEFRRFLGVLYLIGVYRGKNEPVAMLWNISVGRECIRKGIARDLFLQILRFLRYFSDPIYWNLRRSRYLGPNGANIFYETKDLSLAYGRILQHVDIAAVNAFVIWSKIHAGYQVGKRHRRLLFIEELAQILASTQLVANPPRTFAIPQSASGSKRGRCYLCPRETDRKVSSKCSNCQKFTCVGHSVCHECGNK